MAGGLYGAALGADVFTLHWKWFFWEILHGYPSGGGARALQKPHGHNSDRAWLMVAGTMAGVPIALTADGRHELRFGLGLLGGAMDYGMGPDSTQGTTIRSGKMHFSLGPHVEFAASYVYRFYRHLALEAGLSVIVPTQSHAAPPYEDSDPHNRPWPALQGFVGLRF